MNRKTVSGIMLTLLLMSMLTLGFNIQLVRASGTIYIRPDGSVDGTDEIQQDGDVYTFLDNIHDGIVIERDNIVVDGASYAVQGTGSGTGINLTRIGNVTIRNMEIKAFEYGMWLVDSSNNTVVGNNITANNVVGVMLSSSSGNSMSGNNITNNEYGSGIGLEQSSNHNTISGNNITNNEGGCGIVLDESSNNTMVENNITNNEGGCGIVLDESSNHNTISGNNVANNWCGIGLRYSSNNTICHNNFVDNSDYQVQSYESTNVWDNGYPSGGNFWSDHSGVDVKSGPNQDQPSSDGLSDIPYVIDGNNRDNYPLMYPWGFPLVTLTIYSAPVAGVTFAIGNSYCLGETHTTPSSGNYSAYYNESLSLIMPWTHTVGGLWYYWDQWEDGATSRLRTVTMNTNVTLTAYYTGPYSKPPEPREETLGVYYAIESRPAGSIVILSFDYGPSCAHENNPQAKALLFHCKQLGMKVVALAFWASGGPLGHDILTQVYGEGYETSEEYGTDIVYLGYVPGNEVGMQTFGDSTSAVKGTDHYGWAISDLPLMQECRSAADFDLWMEVTAGTPGEQQVIQFVQGRHGGPSAVPLVVGSTAVKIPGMMPFYQAGQILGILDGLVGTAEYEWLLYVHTFDAIWDDVNYPVVVQSNSTVAHFAFNQTKAEISFNVTGGLGTVGYCNVTIANNLLWGDYTVYLDGTGVPYAKTNNSTHTSLYFTYNHSTKTVHIQATEVIPEFPLFLILPLLTISTLLAVIVHRRKYSQAT